jgi:LysR family transcriptional regulator, flagellar master operon regulator
MNFSEETPALFIDLGPLALSYVLSTGGSGYFRMSAVEPLVRSGQLHFVPEAQQFSYPIYVVYTEVDDEVLGPALSGLRTIIAEKKD